ncbi:MAG: hypothetical protein IBX50_14495 [Marinospirillum sp.]|uniref:hypothetical protein n=1 Tax=Marinospirillum sp. TaxID=2183934 RepID=UPI0019FDF793|nr:hypothetical protein [Marinospirillum sp.]MBE0507898.1 hypothetical protein [Marinospirillum sp.]
MLEDLGNFIMNILLWLYEQVQDLVQWFFDGLEYLFIELILSPVLNALASLLESIPLPDWFTHGTVSVGSAGYFIAMAEVPAGITMIISAYTIRFLIRRIPVIG